MRGGLLQHRPGSDATRRPRVLQSARAPRPSATKRPSNSSSKALQWAKAVGAKPLGRSSGRHPRSASCPSRGPGNGPSTAGRLVGGRDRGTTVAADVEGGLREREGHQECGSSSTAADGGSRVGDGAGPPRANRDYRLSDASGHVEYVGGRFRLVRGDSARTKGARDRGGGACADAGRHDGCTVGGGGGLTARGVNGAVHGYSSDGDGYSDDSFAPDGDNDSRCRNHEEESCEPNGYRRSELRTTECSDFEHGTVDTIPSMLVETGRGVD